METNELYEKVRSAAIGTVLEHNGKVGTVENADDFCRKCIYFVSDARFDGSMCHAAILDCDGWPVYPCDRPNRHDNKIIIIRENKGGESC